jgi:ATP-dependent Clp protease ATP-binding subunit ClpB
MNLNNFTIKSQEAIQQAQQIANGFSHSSIETGHLLKSLLEIDEQTIGFLLKKVGTNIVRLNQALDAILQSYPKVSGDASLYLSSAANQVLVKAQNSLKEFGDEFVAVEHLLLALLTVNDPIATLLKDAGLNEKGLKAAIKELHGGSTVNSQNAEAQYNALNKYAKNLNELAQRGKLDPVIGRDEEIRRVLQILSRRTKNNPVLIGEPGVGKTAIAEGLAHRIVNGDVPENLKRWFQVANAKISTSIIVN